MDELEIRKSIIDLILDMNLPLPNEDVPKLRQHIMLARKYYMINHDLLEKSIEELESEYFILLY